MKMDILKLLSRPTKQTNKPGSSKDAPKLPSAGTPANPQLYHDAVPESRGKKRKRGGEKVEAQLTQDEDDEGLNFFAQKDASKEVKKGKKNENDVEGGEVALETKISEAQLLDEGECRQILRSHRLKLTLLPASKLPEKKIKKSKKSKSSGPVPSTKGEFKQLYPQPLMDFAELRTTYGISGRLNENLAGQGYKIPTEVQMGSLPLLLQPKTALRDSLEELEDVSTLDLLAVAPTGSGKTLAFLIPMVNSILQRRRTSQDKGAHELEGIIVAPTKELASQIVNEAKKLSIGTGIKVVGMRKGMRIVAGNETAEEQDSSESEEDDEEEEKPKKGTAQPLVKADVLVTTPLILVHALSKSPLPSVRTLVLDEADVLLDPLFREQTLGIWEACINPDLRVTLWSATMGSNIEALVSTTIQERKQRLHLDTPARIIRLVVGLKDSAIPNITHRLTYAATEPGKLIALRQLLHPTSSSSETTQSLRPPFLVFTQTIPRAVALHSELLYDIPAEAGGSTRLAVLHSDLSDSSRSNVMTRFRNGEIWILITTDILSRGIDFRGINGVVNYDVPNSGASYIHRVGRTGRAGRDGGIAVTLYTKEDIPYIRDIANIIAASEKQAGKPASEASVQKWFLDALPKVSKEDKKRLKLYGVEARRSGLGGKDKVGKDKGGKEKGGKKMQISTKSGYERKLENKKRGAIEGSKRRVRDGEKIEVVEDGEWGGLDD